MSSPAAPAPKGAGPKPSPVSRKGHGIHVGFWAFACVGVFLLAIAATLGRPGLPQVLKADEPTTFLMATSLALDRDLQPSTTDLERLYRQYAFTGPVSVDLASDDGWATSHYARPWLYPLLAAPLVGLFGGNGFYLLNVACFLATLWLISGSKFRRPGVSSKIPNILGPGLALATLGLVASAGFPYLFSIDPAWLLAFLITAGLAPFWRPSPTRTLPAVLAGLGLALAIACQPWWILLLPAVLLAARARRGGEDRLVDTPGRQTVRGWLAGFTAAALVLTILWLVGRPLTQTAPSETGPTDTAATSTAATNTAPTNTGLEESAGQDPGEKAGRELASFTVDGPWESPWTPKVQAAPPAPAWAPTPAREVLGEPDRGPVEGALTHLAYSLVERRTGFLPYFPISLVLLVLFWRDRRQALLADYALLAAVGVLVLAQAWIASPEVGGELFANPGLVALYPCLFFLLRRPPGLLSISAAAFLGALLLGPALVSTLGPAMAYGNPQGHTRSPLLSRLPLDLSHVGRGDGYSPTTLGQVDARSEADFLVRIWLPRYAAERQRDEIWLLGATRTEIFLEAPDALGPTHWQVRTLAPGNRLKLDVEGTESRLSWPREIPLEGASTRMMLDLREGTRVSTAAGPRRVWRLSADIRTGERAPWRRGSGEPFYLGAALALLGSESHLQRPIFGIEWSACEAPTAVEPGEEFLALARLSNTSNEAWNHTGAARVRLAYRWYDEAGNLAQEGPRIDLARNIEPGEVLETWVAVVPPAQASANPGTYTLGLEPIYENVAWFSDHLDDAVCQARVRIGAAR